jgi:hypothetical protein
VKDAGPDGISKVVEKFVVNHPSMAKRQVELKIQEIAVKEKRATDSKLVCLLELLVVIQVKLKIYVLN